MMSVALSSEEAAEAMLIFLATIEDQEIRSELEDLYEKYN